MGGRERSRASFGGCGAASDGHDTATNGGANMATNRACCTDRGGRDTAGRDPTNAGGGGGGHDRWVIVGRNHSGAYGTSTTRAIGGLSDDVWRRLDGGGY